MATSSTPRLWHHTHPEATAHRSSVPTLVGRQGIFTARGVLCGYELLFRAAGLKGARADLWDAVDQDFATEHVIAAAFHQGTDVTSGRDASVNFTGQYLLNHHDLYCDPKQVIVEIVESTKVQDALIHRLRELKILGFRIALDDFVATDAQCELLPFADFVKVDLNDIAEKGTWLMGHAYGEGRVLVAERVETQEELQTAVELGFDQFQGYFFERPDVLSIPRRQDPTPT